MTSSLEQGGRKTVAGRSFRRVHDTNAVRQQDFLKTQVVLRGVELVGNW